MHTFTMNGMQITGFERFQSCFCPEDFLRQREAAAGFAATQLSSLSPASCHHSEMLYRAVFDWDSGFFGNTDSPDFYGAMELSGILPVTSAAKADARRLWALCQATDLVPSERSRMFCMLMAGYGLSLRSLSDTPLTPANAERAYRRTLSASEDEPFFHPIPPDGPIVLSARTVPYRFLLDHQRAKALLSEGKSIRPRKLLLAEHWQGDSGLSVIIELHTPEGHTETLSLAPGDYRMMNFVEDVPMLLHPVAMHSGAYTLRREGGILRLMKGETELERISCAHRDILSMALEQTASHLIRPGFIVTDTERADYSRYSDLDTHRPWLRRKGIVEVALRGGLCYLLHESGTLYTNHQGLNGKKLLCLDELFEEGGSSHDL